MLALARQPSTRPVEQRYYPLPWTASSSGDAATNAEYFYDYAGQDPINNYDLSGTVAEIAGNLFAEGAGSWWPNTGTAGAVILIGTVAGGVYAYCDNNSCWYGHQARNLPSSGPFPFRPGKGGAKKEPGGRGYRDKYGNLWEWDQHGGQGGHWDVQRSRRQGGRYTRVNGKGKVIGGSNRSPLP